MEDFLSKHPFYRPNLPLDHAPAGQPPRLVIADSSEEQLAAFEQAAEAYVLARYKTLRFFGGLPNHMPTLERQDRIARLQDQIAFWQTGCSYAIDERLLADLLRRRRAAKA
ncbi:hypothetical protein [Roseibium sp.]|uniref:hypothetical protein n=1 Tax=Roseibium sp. TaxID=1936156 RepID=UPI003A96F87B